MAMASPAHYGSMPTIRCTTCNAEIDISRAGEHVCGNAMQPMDRFNNAFSSMRTNQNIPHPFMPRPPPTRIDPALANRPYTPSPLTPNVLAPPKSPFRVPPRSATASPRPPPRRAPSPDLQPSQECAFPAFPLPKNNGAKKAPERSRDRSRERVPELPYERAQEEFRPAPEPEHHSLGLPPGLQSGTGDDRRDTASTYSVTYPSSPRSRSSSMHRPRTAGSDTARKASFSSNRSRPDVYGEHEQVPPMPFFNDRRGSPAPAAVDSPRLPFVSPDDMAGNPYDHMIPAPPPPPADEPARPLGHFRQPSKSAASRPLYEIGSVKTHRPTLSRGASPARLDVDFPNPRGGSAMSIRSDLRLHDAPPVPGMSAVQIEDLNSSHHQEQHEASPPRMGGGYMSPNANPYRMPNMHHSPTESVSSNGSATRTQSSRSSPPTSAASFGHIKNHYGADEGRHYGNLSQDSTNRSYSDSPASPQRSEYDSNDTETPPPIPPTSPRRNQHLSQFPPRGQSRNVPPQQLPHYQEPQSPPFRSPYMDMHQPQLPPPESQQPTLPPLDIQAPTLPQLSDPPAARPRPSKSFSRPSYARPMGVVEPESPMDPAMPGSRLAPIDTNPYAPPKMAYATDQQLPMSAPATWTGDEYDMDGPRTPLTAPPMRHGGGFGDVPRPPASAPPTRNGPTMPPPPPSPGVGPDGRPLPPLRRATTGTKGKCRGCSEPIRGKSVSSADGRLTGRWHKQCFTCKTCQQAFPTSDFYVFANQPYCARHYHQLNRTLCANCDRGIEGQYVETDRAAKFHPHCFSCTECHLILRDNYFEDHGGKIMCEQHAFNSTSRLGSGRRFPERRTTRLMMMT